MSPADYRHIIAAAIANARGARRGAPRISNILDALPERLRDEVLDDADFILRALHAEGLRIVSKDAP